MNKYSKAGYPADAFAGTAGYYARYRVPYPQVLVDDLIKRAEIPPDAKLLDIASGPGRIAIRFAPLFSKVFANDVDSEMITVGKNLAKEYNVNNIEWHLGKAEELNFKSNSIDLITIGEAFHRLDQNLIANLSLQWLNPGGHIAIIGCYSVFSGNESWQNIITEIVSKWTSHDFSGPTSNREPTHYKHVLQDIGFIDCDSYSFFYPYYWTIESIIGCLYSTSVCSKKVLGDKAAGFESDIKAALMKINARGRYFENMQCGYTIGRKPLS
jgi:SAM-dependent methyltransferase